MSRRPRINSNNLFDSSHDIDDSDDENVVNITEDNNQDDNQYDADFAALLYDDSVNNIPFDTTAVVYKSDDDLVRFDCAEPNCHVIKVCDGKPIYINSTQYEYRNSINYYIPRIWFANPAVIYTEQELNNTYKKEYAISESIKVVFFEHMRGYMNTIVEIIKYLCENIESLEKIIEMFSKMLPLWSDNLCSAGFVMHKNAMPPDTYNGYYVYRINNFLRDYDHTILYDFIIIAPYPIFGGTKLYNSLNGKCISANYLYGAMFLQTEIVDIKPALKYNITYKFLTTRDDSRGNIIETNDYNRAPQRAARDSQSISTEGGSGHNLPKFIYFILIAFIILLVFVYLNSMNKHIKRCQAPPTRIKTIFY